MKIVTSDEKFRKGCKVTQENYKIVGHYKGHSFTVPKWSKIL